MVFGWPGVPATVTVTESVPVLRRESVADAVMMWVPALSVWSKLAPVPRLPTTLEVQMSFGERFPSSLSTAVAAKWTRSPALYWPPSVGLVMVTTGAVLRFGAVTFSAVSLPVTCTTTGTPSTETGRRPTPAFSVNTFTTGVPSLPSPTAVPTTPGVVSSWGLCSTWAAMAFASPGGPSGGGAA